MANGVSVHQQANRSIFRLFLQGDGGLNFVFFFVMMVCNKSGF